MVTREKVRPIWKCRVEGCTYTAIPTVEGYRKVSGHQLSHIGLPKAKKGFHLVDETTGDVLAQKLEEAIAKGFIATKPPEPITTPAPPAVEVKQAEPAAPAVKQAEPVKQAQPEGSQLGGVKGRKDGKEETITEPAVSPDGIFAYTVHLPADAFSLFNLAKFSGLEKDGDKPFDEWLWECVTKRFEKDYKMRLVLAPIEEQPAGEVKNGKGA